MSVRVRQLVAPLVQKFQDIKCLPPNIEWVFNNSTIIKYPPFVYSFQKKYNWIFSHYGIFMEHVIREMKNDNGDNKWISFIQEIYKKTSLTFIDHPIEIPHDELKSLIARFVNIKKYIHRDFADTNFLYNFELLDNTIIGHPDIIVLNDNKMSIYDITPLEI